MKRKKNTQYFSDREEQAVIDYISSNSVEVKNKIYNEILIQPFRIMIESILRRYPIHIGYYDIKEVESNALTHLIEHMVKFKRFIIERRLINYVDDKWNKLGDDHRFIYIDDVNSDLKILSKKNDGYDYRIFFSKAFSYCQTIIRNYYKDHSKKSYVEKTINLSYDNYVEELNRNKDYSYEIEMDENSNQLERFINVIVDKIKDRIETDTSLKKIEVVVGDAILNVLKNWHILFMEDTPNGKYNKRITNKFAKSKILLFLKEQTSLSTKEIRLGIKPFKELYFLEKNDYFD